MSSEIHATPNYDPFAELDENTKLSLHSVNRQANKAKTFQQETILHSHYSFRITLSVLQCTSSYTLDKLFKLSRPQFPQL